MSLNPVQFGKDVIDQFGRYLLTTFPVADERLARQVRARFGHTIGEGSLLYKGPYVYLNRPFLPGPEISRLVQEGRLHEVMRSVFPYDALHYHQARALDVVQNGGNLILSTGTGSGKTEAFMLPIVDYCLRLPNQESGVVAVLVYPMNALVNDQLDRLRWTLAGTRVTFGRYTGETERTFPETMHQQPAPVNYTSNQRDLHKMGDANFGDEALPLPWEECYDQDTIRNRRPRILLTNYAQLEYLLLRDRDLGLFRDAPLKFIVFDEVHTYTGALGSEVACLIRRVRDVARKAADEVIMIGTSATVSDDPDEGLDTEALTRRFAHRLFGVPEDTITVVRETYRDLDWGETYLPPLPYKMEALLDVLLDATRALQLQTEIEPGDVPNDLIVLTAELCGRGAGGSGMDQLGDLLRTNRCIARLSEVFTEPRTWHEIMPRWRALGGGRDQAPDDDLIAEMLAYLTLGALVVVDGDPLLRPKLHYFVQGLQGLGIIFHPDADPQVTFGDNEAVQPLLLCRSCGQHYTRLIVGSWEASNDSPHAYRFARIPSRFEEPEGDTGWLYLTDQFHTEDEDDEGDARWQPVYMCQHCLTIHEKHEPQCLNPRCRASDPLITLSAYLAEGKEGIPGKCGACGGPNTQRTPLISYTRSAAVADVTILGQSMLTMMSEPSLRKLLIFADSRQEVAFQAGWMQERGKRFRMRHLAFQIAQGAAHPLNWDDFATEVVTRAAQSGIFYNRDFNDRENQVRARWFLIEELAFVTQRRSNLEQLGLLEIVYGGLDQPTDTFFQEWAERLSITPEAVLACVRLLLDTMRRRGHLSDDLLARYWSDQDREVFQGWISVPDFYRPTALALEKTTRSNSLKGWLASNGRSLSQVTLQKALGTISGSNRNQFLTALWEWLVEQQYLVPVELVQRRRGAIQAIPHLPDQVFQVNVARMGIQEAQVRYECGHCHRAQQVMTPSGRCPEYGCNGTLHEAGRDYEHFDVYQYTQREFVPLEVREHSAQVKRERRLEAEREFKSETGTINTIVATPTLELGVDIGKLEMVMMRNVPPTPANYAQRAGRAGRRHRIGAVFSYAGGSQHDRYFYADPPAIIAGSVRVPAFSMQNAPLIRKHVHSATLTALREWVSIDEREILIQTIPLFIHDYLMVWGEEDGRRRPRYFTSPMTFPDFRRLLDRYRDRLQQRLEALFADWPENDAAAVTADLLATYLAEMPDNLERHVRLLFNQVKAYQDALADLRRIEDQNQGLQPDEKKQRQRLEQARDSYTREDLNNYTLSWLAVDGFFPGYALSKESVQAICLQPLVELSRPSAVALRELTPANWVYADSRIYGVRRLNFGKLRAENPQFSSDSLREELLYEPAKQRIATRQNSSSEGGSSEVRRVISYQLIDVEMEPVQSIDDRRDLRRRVPFNILGTLLNQHHGGEYGRVGERTYRYLEREALRLVNLGPVRVGPVGVEGFPLCPVCGETRSPNSTQVEIDHFRESHRESCNIVDILFSALHVDLTSDVLCLGPYDDMAEAVNVYEALIAGARNFLDMGGDELEGFFYTDEHDGVWAVLYDPLPGGTGFLAQLLHYWDTTCEKGIEAMQHCDCETACYKCLQHFRNQQYHDVLDRHSAIQLLSQLRGAVYKEHAIPAMVQQTLPDNLKSGTESPAEIKFLNVLEKHGFPTPAENQFRVELGNRNYTVADFAWPEKFLIIFIDGTSPHLHGDPTKAKRDRDKRRQAGMLGWRVLTITAQELDDEQAMAVKLEDIAFFLEQ